MMKKLKENKMFVISIIAVLFIPILYAGNFITAFSDPYNRMSQVNVAIVNDDEGTTYNDSDENIGNEFVSNLKENNNFNWDFVTDEEALEGMENNEYYFTVKIPSDFSSNVYSTLSGTEKEAKLIYMANDNSNYISGVLGSALVNELNSELNEQIVSNFISELGTNLDDAKELSSGVLELLDGSDDITTGLDSLKDGSKELYEGVSDLSSETTKLKDGVNTLDSSYNEFNSKLNGFSDSLNQVATGYNTLDTSLASYRSSLLVLISTSTLSDAQKTALLNGYDQMLGASNTLNSNMNLLNNGSKSLSANSTIINESLNTINSGVGEIDSYLIKVKDSTNTLYKGTTKLYNGSLSLNSGLGDLSSGIDELNDSISDLDLTNNADNIASPVTRVDEAYTEVDNYGYGFAPYFISLGLFVGALVTTIILSMKEKKSKAKVNDTKHALKKVGLFAGVVTSQALILDIIILLTQIKVSNILLFVAFTILISLTFMAIIQMLSTLFGDVGRFISIILLILQLTSCGGTFPIETSPSFYNFVNPFMPMTYTVNGLRMIIGSGNTSILVHSVLVLISITIVCYVITIVYFKKSKKFA